MNTFLSTKSSSYLVLLFLLFVSCDYADSIKPVDLGLEPVVSIKVLNTDWEPTVVRFSRTLEGKGISFLAEDYSKFKGDGDWLSFGFILPNEENDFLVPFDLKDLEHPYGFDGKYKDYENSGTREWRSAKPEDADLFITQVRAQDGRVYYDGSFEVVVCNTNMFPACHKIIAQFKNVQYFDSSEAARDYVLQVKIRE
ncbi:hypothetical protein [Roseivirga pacifica]|jgi:hypothetical protein|uniref:hypothetical protein n=1 Tax=Roseivirga pacifica TaxID=1267423 RepID=UPI003BAAF285